MEKEAFEFLAAQANTAADKRVQVVNGKTFLIGDDVRELTESSQAKKRIVTHSLTSIIDYVQGHVDRTRGQEKIESKLLIQIVAPDEVRLLGELDQYGNREILIDAEPLMDQFEFGSWTDRESLNIALQSMFVKNDDRDTLLEFIGKYKESNDTIANDDGITQGATIKVGAGTVQDVKVPNPVTLMPFRTFTEVGQPESEFIFRMSQGMKGALFEADGGKWRLDAFTNIKDYFEQQLGKYISAGVVVVLG
ncbi:hypothetical protein QU585_09990 [Lactiplantibacillus plantarum]|uniref:hypothetical protein n=1 Tax=Lactiplantibacillus plantarum TaxID=1590 RepID=UPI002741645F|nr:hypothetical protein [Lactiplantibacillus plantarum]MDP5372489.1 hypothetical protein [Lactiplantibacillus plantarum]